MAHGILSGVLLGVAFLTPSVLAATATTTFNVTMAILPICTIVANPLAFATYTGAVDAATTTLVVTCSSTTSYNVGLGTGLGTGATVLTRRATSGGGTLGYALFSDSARSVNWGQTVGVDTVAGIGSGGAQVLTVYGQIPAAQNVAPGVYTDTVVATVTY